MKGLNSMIGRNEDVKCPRCNNISKLGEWNDLTYSKCVNREMKRVFTQLTQEKAFKNNTDSYYVCPICNDWSRGNQLKIVNTTNEKLLKLGGQSIMTMNSN